MATYILQGLLLLIKHSQQQYYQSNHSTINRYAKDGIAKAAEKCKHYFQQRPTCN